MANPHRRAWYLSEFDQNGPDILARSGSRNPWSLNKTELRLRAEVRGVDAGPRRGNLVPDAQVFASPWTGPRVAIIDSVYRLVDLETDVEFDLAVIDVNGTRAAILPDREMIPGHTYFVLDGGADRDLVSEPDFAMGFPDDATIATPDGPRGVAEIITGDFVLTPDGPAEVQWTGRQIWHVGGGYPVMVNTDTHGNTAPLVTGSDYLVRSVRPPHVFASLGDLVGMPGVSEAPYPSGQSYHILLDKPQVIFVNGLPIVSTLPGPTVIRALAAADQARLLAMYPHIQDEFEEWHFNASVVSGGTLVSAMSQQTGAA